MLEIFLHGSIQILQYYTNFFVVFTFHIVNIKLTELCQSFSAFLLKCISDPPMLTIRLENTSDIWTRLRVCGRWLCWPIDVLIGALLCGGEDRTGL